MPANKKRGRPKKTPERVPGSRRPVANCSTGSNAHRNTDRYARKVLVDLQATYGDQIQPIVRRMHELMLEQAREAKKENILPDLDEVGKQLQGAGDSNQLQGAQQKSAKNKKITD